jgi:hypothetical protein
MTTNSQDLKVLARLCNSGMCPALYADKSGRVFVQGSKLSPEGRNSLTVPLHEEVVEISPELIAFLKAN